MKPLAAHSSVTGDTSACASRSSLAPLTHGNGTTETELVDILGDLGGWLPRPAARATRLAQLLAAVGLRLPSWLDTLPILSPSAAAGLVVIMLGGIVVHVRRSEYPNIAVNVVLAAIAAVIAWGRFGPHQF